MQESVSKSRILDKEFRLPAELTNFFKKIRTKNPGIRFGLHGSFVTDTIFRICFDRKDLIPSDIDVFVFLNFSDFKEILVTHKIPHKAVSDVSITLFLENNQNFQVIFPDEQNFSKGRASKLLSIGFELDGNNKVKKIINEDYLDDFLVDSPLVDCDQKIDRYIKRLAKYGYQGNPRVIFDEKFKAGVVSAIQRNYKNKEKLGCIDNVPVLFFLGHHERLNAFDFCRSIEIEKEKNFINVLFPFEPDQKKIKNFIVHTLRVGKNNPVETMVYFLWPYFSKCSHAKSSFEANFARFRAEQLNMWSMKICDKIQAEFFKIFNNVEKIKQIDEWWDACEIQSLSASKPQGRKSASAVLPPPSPSETPQAETSQDRSRKKEKGRIKNRHSRCDRPKKPMQIFVPPPSENRNPWRQTAYPVPSRSVLPVAPPAAFFRPEPPPRASSKNKRVLLKPEPQNHHEQEMLELLNMAKKMGRNMGMSLFITSLLALGAASFVESRDQMPSPVSLGLVSTGVFLYLTFFAKSPWKSPMEPARAPSSSLRKP